MTTSFILLAYAIGGIIEVISSLYFKRLAGNVLWSIYVPSKVFKKHHKLHIRIAMLPLQIFLALVLLPIGILMSIFRTSMFEWRPHEVCIGTRVKGNFEKLPKQVIESLSKPFGELSDLSWEYFSVSGTIKHQKFARKLKASMSDMIVLISSITVSLFFFLPEAMDYYLCIGKEQCQQPQDGSDPAILFFQYLLFIFIVISLTLGLYASLVKQSILILLEHQGVELEVSEEELIELP
ncbi:MAG: hypothetical protein AAGE59_38310 [Cyanobacteria bacterium P01_F01_bin.86]